MYFKETIQAREAQDQAIRDKIMKYRLENDVTGVMMAKKLGLAVNTYFTFMRGQRFIQKRTVDTIQEFFESEEFNDAQGAS